MPGPGPPRKRALIFSCAFLNSSFVMLPLPSASMRAKISSALGIPPDGGPGRPRSGPRPGGCAWTTAPNARNTANEPMLIQIGRNCCDMTFPFLFVERRLKRNILRGNGLSRVSSLGCRYDHVIVSLLPDT